MAKILKTQKYNLLIVAGIFIAAILIAATFLFVYYTQTAKALDGSAGQPAHSHSGWPCLNCGSYSSGYVSHLQAELNFLHANLSGFYISGYPLAVNGSWNSATYNAVRNFQSYVNILVDGKVGNQTWSYLEFWVLTSPGITIDASAHPAGVTVKYPIYGTCRAIGNGNGTAFAAPLRTKAEWNAYRANAPNLSDVAGDCSITSGSGSGGGGGGDSTGGTGCSNVCQDYDAGCPASCFYCTGTPSYNPDCAPYGSLCIC